MLPKAAIDFLTQAAKDARTALPNPTESLFTKGVLDSFSLVDFVTVLEKECKISIDDSQLRPETFDTIAKIEAFLEKIGA